MASNALTDLPDRTQPQRRMNTIKMTHRDTKVKLMTFCIHTCGEGHKGTFKRVFIFIIF